MLGKYKRSIKREFFITGISSVLIIAAIFITFLTIIIYYLSVDNARQKLMNANLHLSTYTEGVLESLEMSAKINVAYSEALIYTSRNQQVKVNLLNLFDATAQANQNILFCYAGYETGELLINNYTPPDGYDPRVRPWYTAAIDKYPNLSVGLPYQEAKTEKWLISVSKALVNDKDEFIGVIAVDCSLSYINALMNEVVYYESQDNYVVDSDGMVFIHTNSMYLHQMANSFVPGVNELFNEDSGYIRYKLDGIQRRAFYRKMPLTNWIVVSAIDESEIMKPIIVKILIAIIVLLVLAVLLGMAQVKLYEVSLVNPILMLRDRIAEITVGKAVTQSGYEYSNQELSEIASRIEEMAATSLRKKTYELELILESTSDGILVLNLDGQVIHTNSKFEELVGLSEKLRQGDTLAVFKEHMLYEYFSIKVEKEGNKQRILHLENGTVLEQYTCELMDEGLITGRLWSYRDITDKARAEEELKRLATTDSLTTLWNRHYFMDKGTYEVNQAQNTKQPLTLLFIDIDHFKQINDSYGHSVGDEALKYMAVNLKKYAKNTDIIARMGGEEFCILLPNTNLDSACLFAEKLKAYFESSYFNVQEHTINFTLSIGISVFDIEKNNIGGIELLLDTADQACYQAKANGRNCVIVFTEKLTGC